MKVRLKIFALLGLLALMAAVYFWPRSGRPVVAQNPAAGAVVANSHSVPAIGTTNASIAAGSGKLSAASTNRLMFRLTNTTRSIGQLTGDRHAILLENAFIDTSAGLSLNIPSHLKAAAEPGAYIVQARGIIDGAFRNAIAGAGGTVVSYIPNNAYLVQISSAGAAVLSGDAQVQAVLPYEPYYKVSSTLLGAAVKQQPLAPGTYLTLGLFNAGAQATEAQLTQLGAQILSTDRSPFGPIVRVRPPADWIALANLPGVQIMEPVYLRKVANDLSRVSVGVSVNTTDGATNDYLGLTGKNVLVEVNDTGIDPTHPDFSVIGSASAPGSTPPSRVTGDFTNSLYDTDGHGTHVAGIIAGNGSKSHTVINASGSVTNADFRGKAPNALLYSVGGIIGGNDTNIDTSDSYLQEVPALTNALISNNSWEYGNAEYDLAAASYDAAVRDAVPEKTGPQPVLFVFAAGNEGGGNDDGSEGAADSVSSPGTAKNVITVGALEQLRRITNIVTALDGTSNAIWAAETDTGFQVAGYSSRGNVGVQTEGTFGRFKPDVVAPGTFVVSTRSQVWDEAAYYNPVATNQNVVVDFVTTNTLAYGSVSVPQNAVGVSVQVVADPQSPVPFPTQFPIYISVTGTPDPTDTATYDISENNTNFIAIPPASGGLITGISSLQNGGFTYAVGEPTNQTSPMIFDVIETVITTNDLGNELTVLSNLNDSIDGDIGTHYYRYESGTSMATPSVSGVLALMQDFFVNQKNPNFSTNPSPALLKAMVVNGARMTGSYNYAVASPINYEGWGLVNLPNSIPAVLTNSTPNATNGTPLFFVDQSPTNALATGGSQTYQVALANATAQSQTLRVTLAWTDPPGNPAAAIKLVNDLELVVTNLSSGAVYYANNFSTAGTPSFSTPFNSTNAPAYDGINNVQNIFLPPTLGTNYSVTVYGRAVNVNAVTLEQTNIVQDYALVIACGSGNSTAGITVTPSAPTLAIQPHVDYLASSNSIYFNEIAGANAPWLSTNDLGFGTNNSYGFASGAVFHVGQTNQWHFFVVTNTTTFTNAAFITFLPDTLATPREGVFAGSDANSTRPEASLQLLVASAPDALAAQIVNLNATVISNCLFNVSGDESAVGRGGTQFVVYSNAQPGQIYYIGVQCADQMAGQFGFVPLFSQNPFSTQDKNGNIYVNAVNVPNNIPDGNNAHPGVSYVFGLAIPTDPSTQVRNVTVTNTITHQNFGDLFGTLSHGSAFSVLNNHDGLGPVINDPLIYDDSGQGDVPGAMHSDGPGSLQNFTGSAAIGPWILNEIDDSFGNTGTVQNLQLRIEPHRNLTQKPFIVVSVPPGGWFYDYIDVPVGYTNLLVVATNLAPTSIPPIQLFVKEGSDPTLADTNDGVSLTNCPVGTYPTGVNPGNSISLGPPLTPDVYYVGIYNPDTVSHDVLVGAVLSFNSAAISTINYDSTETPLPLLDDAVTVDSNTLQNSTIFVPDAETIQGLSVGLRVDHPRISDMVFTLISPDGTRYLLMENRGGQSTNGCGATFVTTNTFSATANGSAQANTNYINVGTTSGTIPITYNFYTAQDQMVVYYGTNLLDTNYNTVCFNTGFTNNPTGPTTIQVSFPPPGVPANSTYLTIVMDQYTPPGRADAWTYTAGGVQTNYEYLDFTEDTNLTTTPIQFAPPPFTPQTSFVPLMTESFENPYEMQPYVQGSSFGGWFVATNEVVIVTNPPAFAGTQLLQLTNGVVVTNLTTVPGQKYVLTYEQGSLVTVSNELIVPSTNANWAGETFTFTAVATNTPLVLAGSADALAGLLFTNAQTLIFDTNALLDDLVLTPVPGNLYYQAEQSLSPLIGTSAFGDWQLEALDNRTGATNPQPELVSWQLSFTYANTNYLIPIGSLNNGVDQTNFIAPGAFQWFQIIVPTNALAQTNSLLFANLPLNIWFSTTNPPTTNAPFGTLELGNSTGGSVVVNPSSVPLPMIPGTTNYLGVQNPNQFGVTYGISVTFELTNVPTFPYGTTNVLPFANSLPATGVTGTNAQLNGFATPNTTNGSTATAWFQWGLTVGYGNVTPPKNVGGGFSVVYVDAPVSNLIFAEVYHCRLVVSNNLGVAYGADELFAPGFVHAWGDNTFGQTNVPVNLSNVVAVAGGTTHSVALINNGTVTAWGGNNDHQTNVPAGLSNVVAVAAGGFSSLAMKSDGTVVAWGDNTYGQTNVPGSLSNVVEVADGANYSLALRSDGTVVAWGDDTYGETNFPAGLSNVVAVAAGSGDGMALLNNGSVVAWGDDAFGEANVPPGVTNTVAVAAGIFHDLALQNNGTVVGWGHNVNGETNIPANLTNVVAIAAGLGDNLVLQTNGNVVAWGNNSLGQTNVPPGLGTVYAVACGAEHDLVLTPEPPLLPPYASTLPATSVTGTSAQLNGFATPNETNNTLAAAWFQWGTSTNYGSQSPPVSVGNGVNVVYVTNAISGLIYGQAYHFQLVVSNYAGVTYGFDQLLVAGSTVAWGYNNDGQSTPPAGFSNVVAVAAGYLHSLEILTNGMALAWGDDTFGQTNVPPGLNAVAVAGGFAHSVALSGNGVVTAWGDNTYGQTNVPGSLTNAVAVAGGGNASLALQNNGVVTAWGDNTFGQMKVPAGLSNVVAVAEGREHSLALLNNGTVVGWGTNTYGEISVPAMNNVVAVAAGSFHSLALLGSGAVVAWGLNDAGQTTVPAICSSNVVAIAAGELHSLALLNNGSVVVWGDDTAGQTNVPDSASNVVAVAAGAYHNVVLTSPYPLNLTLFPYPTNGVPVTNVVAPGGINWFQINVPTNAIAATNTLLFATLPVNLLYTTNFPPTTNAPGDAELLTNLNNGVSVINDLTTRPLLVPGGTYYLGVQNPNSLPVTNAIEVTFEYATPPSLPFIPFQFVEAGDTLVVSNMATDIYPGNGLLYNLTTNTFFTFALPPDSTNTAVNPVIDTNGTITWATPTNSAFIFSLFTTTVEDTTTGLGAQNNFFVLVFPQFNIGVPQTNVVAPNSISWQLVQVPANAIAATNALISATSPVNLWYSTNLPPTITTPADQELLNNSINGTNVINNLNTVPLLVPGGYYFLGVQNLNAIAVTNVLQVTFRYGPGPSAYAYTEPATLQNGNSAQLNGFATPSGPARAWFQWGTNTAYGNQTPPVNLAGNNVIYVTNAISGLTTNVPYHFQLVVSNAAGVVYGFDQIFDQADVVAWGLNGNNQTSVPSGLTNVVAVSGGNYHSLALQNNGTVTAWGDDLNGQCDVPAGLNAVVAVAGGGRHSLALKSDGTVVAWGDDTYGQTDVPAGLSGVVTVSAGGQGSLGLKSDGTVVAWGDDTYGQTDVPAGLKNVVAIAAGQYHNLALLNNGTVVAWGYDVDGETNVPAGLTNVVAVAAGQFHSLALLNSGTVTAWGNATYGATTPPAGLNKVVAVAAGDQDGLALKNDGSVVAWGNDGFNETNVPAYVSNVVAIATGYAHDLALTSPFNVNPFSPPLVFSIFSIVNTNLNGTNGFLLTWFAPTNTQFHLQWTDSLLPATWANFKGVISFTSYVAATNSEFQYFDDGSQTGGFGPTRFYRLLLLNSPTNTAPEFLLTPPTQVAATNVQLVVTDRARDWDIPAQTLTYSVTNSLVGTNLVLIDNNGVITWTPTAAQAGLTNIITTTVTDNGVPVQSANNSFAVVVAGPQSFSSITISTNGVNLQWPGASNELFNVQWTTNLVPPVNWTIFPGPYAWTNGVFYYTDTNTPFLMKFYQLILLP